jgi:hypothetical protein
MNNNFQTFADFWGIGDPHQNIWFFGVEESEYEVTSQNLQEMLSERKKLRLFKNKVDLKGNSEWEIIHNIILNTAGSNFSKDFKQKYDKLLFSENHSYFFLSYLFPLPKPNRNEWPEIYEKLFGYNQYEWLQYLSDVRSYRYPKLLELWNTYKPNVTICFGKQNWDEFIHMLKLGHEKFEPYSLENIFYYPKQKVMLTPHLSHGQMKGIVRKELFKLINENV